MCHWEWNTRARVCDKPRSTFKRKAFELRGFLAHAPSSLRGFCKTLQQEPYKDRNFLHIWSFQIRLFPYPSISPIKRFSIERIFFFFFFFNNCFFLSLWNHASPPRFHRQDPTRTYAFPYIVMRLNNQEMKIARSNRSARPLLIDLIIDIRMNFDKIWWSRYIKIEFRKTVCIIESVASVALRRTKWPRLNVVKLNPEISAPMYVCVSYM